MIRVASGLAFLSVMSQGIALAALPVITLFFSPEDFNHLAAFSSAALILITVSALRVEMAIPIVRSDHDARALARLGALICLALAGATALMLWLVLPLEGVDPDLNAVLRFLPVAVLFGGAQAILLNLALRRNKLIATGVVRVIQTLAGVLAQIVIGYWALVQFGLVVGFLLNFLIGATTLFILVGRSGAPGPGPTWGDYRRVAQEQRDYIRYSSFDALFNTSGLQVPLFLISVYGEGATGGFLFLAIKLFYTPSTIVSGAFAKIYHSSVGEALREGRQAQLTQDTLMLLMRYGGCFVIAAVLLGPALIGLLMGPEWEPTGQLLAWMAPWIMLQLLASPIATVFMANDQQKVMLSISVLGLVVRISAVVCALIFFPSLAGFALCIGSAVFYLAVLWRAAVLGGISLTSFVHILREDVVYFACVAVVCLVAKHFLDGGLIYG